MLRSRIIPVVLILDDYAVKTVQFKQPKYIGDPINIIRIFNDYEADELIIYDINKNKEKEINFKLIESISFNARMPLSYGGRIKNIQDIKKLFSIGIEKVSISTMATKDLNFVREAVAEFGSQSIVITLDININDKDIWVNNTQYADLKSVKNLINKINDIKVGELIIQSVHRDGMELGLDDYLIDHLYGSCESPITFVGGASSFDNILNVAKKYGVIGIGAGSIFTFKGKQKAVMISYLDKKLRSQITY